MCKNQIHGMTSSKSSRPASGTSLDTTRNHSARLREELPLEVTSVSYLTVPHSPQDPRRPSTADVFIEKLKVERVEGGGISISGVALASNCHLSLLIFGAFFLLAGIVLTYVGFARGGGSFAYGDNDNGVRQAPRTAAVKTNGNMQVIGPSFVLAGLLMLLLGFALFALSKKIQKDENDQRKALSEFQLCQMENDFNYCPASPPLHTTAPSANEPYPILSVRRGSYWMDAVTDDDDIKGRIVNEGTPIEPQVPPISSDPASPQNNSKFSSDWSHAPPLPQVEMYPHVVQDSFPSPRSISTPSHQRRISEYSSSDIATFPQDDVFESRASTAALQRRDLEQEIPYEYYQPQYPISSAIHTSSSLEQTQQDSMLQYQQIQAQRMLKEQKQWRASAGTRHVPHIQVTPSAPSTVALPRLSRHGCSSARPDSQQPTTNSRPTTAEAR